jgi:hypothetical protein
MLQKLCCIRCRLNGAWLCLLLVREKNFDDRNVRRQADREISKRETEMAKQREAYAKYSHFLGCSTVLSDLQNRKEGPRKVVTERRRQVLGIGNRWCLVRSAQI